LGFINQNSLGYYNDWFPIHLDTLMVKRVQPFRSSGSPGESPFSTNSTNTVNRKYMMKSIKTNPNSAKGPDKGKIVNKLYYIVNNT
jgi:hypothetical protein